VHRVDPHLLSEISSDQEAIALGIIESFFRQAFDLLDNPARDPGWSYADPTVISGQGMTSRSFVRMFETVSTSVADFRETLDRPGVFLDVGTGAGWLAIEVARCWPSWRVLGIDCWQPSVQLARANVAASGVEDRIELRIQNIEQLQEERAFSIAWLPGPFLSRQAVLTALEGVRRSLEPRGWVVFSLFSPPEEPWGEAVTALKVTRNGGYPWRREELEDRLRAVGFRQVGTFPTIGSTVTIGQRGAD
jgi:ubiquinone/menaquinone biosynthesis C-methylase UbiE